MKIFIGVAWPYVNGPLHIGHLAGAYLAPDIFARYHRLKGNEVLMVSGSDMHGTPILVAAEKEGIRPIDFAEKYHQVDKEVFKRLGITFDLYTKTSTQNHQKIAQKIFLALLQKNYLFKKIVKQLFCSECRRFLPDRFVEGKCPHCGYEEARGDQCGSCGHTLDPTELISPYCQVCRSKPVLKEGEHFFLDLSQFSGKLTSWIREQYHWRKNVRNTSLGWLKQGLKPRAITRDLDYGVPVPIEGFDNKVLYVWFEAVIGYLSASIEWAESKREPTAWKDFWKGNSRHYYFIGKDNIPFHTLIWPAMLMGYDESLNLPYDVPANQYLNIRGEKLSKSRGTYMAVEELLDKYGVSAVRFYFTNNMPEERDTNFSHQDFVKQNNGVLVGTIGNFINRTLVFIKKSFGGRVPEGEIEADMEKEIERSFQLVGEHLGECHFQKAFGEVVSLAKFGNLYFDQNRPWEKIKTDPQECKNSIYNSVQLVSALQILIEPFLPHASTELKEQLGIVLETRNVWRFEKLPKGSQIGHAHPLFPKFT